MKQMSLIEMDGFLKGKCFPRDLKVNETNAEYLVRKFGELESKLETALRECRSAGITIDNLEAKCAALVAESAGMKKFCKDAAFDADYEAELGMERGGFSDALNEIKTPATDAFLSEVRAQGVDAAIEAAKNLVVQEYEYKDFKAAQSDCCMHPGSDLVGKVEMTEWLVDFAAQLRKGGNQ
ncbi:hNH endonuclease [Escherichia coli]|uniref:hNH endonuclease n=1 Tax=Escherichia coli TaxID=562 RepID=UPI001B9747CD|nr:hNH endonuclease [Escherichia coli]HBC9673404.1 hNH endonuclease [Escherichia coli]